MVNTSFIPPRTLEALHNSSLCAHVECYVTRLLDEGYSTKTIISHVQLFRRFQRWLKRRRRSLRELDERVVDEFLKDRKRDSHDGAPQALRRLLGILRAAGVTPPAESPSRTPAQRIAGEYRGRVSRLPQR